MAGKERLDKLLVARGLVATRAKAQAFIMAGEVRVNGEVVSKAGHQFPISAEIDLIAPMPYVSRGGYKLAGALDQFDLTVAGLVCADVGACTGGFTDVLVQRSAKHVYAIDVGYGQFDWQLRQSEHVTVIERTNARYLESTPQPIDFTVIDVSFISLKLILPAVQKWLVPDKACSIVALIKPQFEAGKKSVGKGGVIRDPAVHRQVLLDTLTWAEAHDLIPAGLTRSSIVGATGNVEFLVWLVAQAEQPILFDWPTAVDTLLQPQPDAPK